MSRAVVYGPHLPVQKPLTGHQRRAEKRQGRIVEPNAAVEKFLEYVNSLKTNDSKEGIARFNHALKIFCPSWEFRDFNVAAWQESAPKDHSLAKWVPYFQWVADCAVEAVKPGKYAIVVNALTVTDVKLLRADKRCADLLQRYRDLNPEPSETPKLKC